MTHKNVSFFILSNTGSLLKKLTVSITLLRVGGVLLTVLLAFSFYAIYDYCDLKQSFEGNRQLQATITHQKNEIADQRRQIQKFALEITELKSKLVALNDFETKIRIIANIENKANQDGLFGVGGSIPDDLDAKIPLTEKHNSLMRAIHNQARQLDMASGRQKQGFESLFNFLQNQRNLLSSTPAIRPTKGWVTSEFGYRISPFTGLREFHKGLDIATRRGMPIIATADGIVSFIGTSGLLGKVIVIDHGHGMVTRYGHAEKIIAKRGQAVKRGAKIGHIGTSGRTTGPHVHYEVRLDGIPVDPSKYILN